MKLFEGAFSEYVMSFLRISDISLLKFATAPREDQKTLI
jgi:hypothetical protein